MRDEGNITRPQSVITFYKPTKCIKRLIEVTAKRWQGLPIRGLFPYSLLPAIEVPSNNYLGLRLRQLTRGWLLKGGGLTV